MALLKRVAHIVLVLRVLSALFDKQRAIATRIKGGERRIGVVTSRRAGKSYLVASLMVAEALRHPGARFLWLGITQKSIRRIAWGVLEEVNKRHKLGMRSNKVDLSWTLPNGSVIEIDGADHPGQFQDKYLGAQYRGVAVDEAGSFSPRLLQYLWTVLRPALSDRRGWCLLIGTPRDYTNGLFYLSTKGQARGWGSAHWKTEENPHMAEQWEADRKELEDENPNYRETLYYMRECEGQWVVDSGRFVYGAFNRGGCLVDGDYSRDDMTWQCGMDLGWNDDASWTVLGTSQTTSKARVVLSYKKKRLLTPALAAECRDIMERFPGVTFFVDPAWKTTAMDLQDGYGIPVRVALKARKNDAIREVNGAFDTRVLVVQSTDCEELVTELEQLPWRWVPSQQGFADQDRVEDPSFPNHCTDGLLYAWRGSRYMIGAEDEGMSEDERMLKHLVDSQSEESSHWEEM